LPRVPETEHGAGWAVPWSAGFRTLNEEHSYRIEDIGGQVPATHWFDGDGMISAIRFGDDGIHYCNRYVATESYLDETRAGRIVHRGFGKRRPLGVLGNAFRQVANVSNTSVVMESGCLLSLWEGGPPMAIDAATLKHHVPFSLHGFFVPER
jgi:all-trans-8'-apo-beta-carotenal 15,15'-oxygenase